MVRDERTYLPSLEGIRALAFLLVFLVHLSGPSYVLTGRTYWAYPWLLMCQLSFCAVPIFFVLSGYLITNVLLRALGKDGFFRVFYLHRALRVLPLYYSVLLVIFLLSPVIGAHILPRHALFVVYLNNFWPGQDFYVLNRYINLGHFWSLAVEEQFYLVWPLAIYLLRDRRKLLWLCYGTMAVTFVARIVVFLAHFGCAEFVYGNTLFRCDAIMLGCALCLHQKSDNFSMARLARWARGALLLCCGILAARALAVGHALPSGNAFSAIIVVPLLSIMGGAVVVLTLSPGSLLERASTWRWAVYLGKRSYSLYVLHQLIVPLFLGRTIPLLYHVLGRGLGRVTGMALAFVVTCAMGELAFRLIETPALRFKKKKIRFGEARPPVQAGLRRQPVRGMRRPAGDPVWRSA